MLIALDRNYKRVHIDDTKINEEYYCQYCKAPLNLKKGDIRMHHFAHAKNHLCTDSWSRERDTNSAGSTWHNDWQALFPLENQEIPLELGSVKHRADVVIGKTVLELQHSTINSEKFADRNKFYSGLGFKVVWIFDCIKRYTDGDFIEYSIGNYRWKNVLRCFKHLNEVRKNGQAEIYFQISANELLYVLNVSEDGISDFSGKIISVTDFLNSLKLQNGDYPLPDIYDNNLEKGYLLFKEKYGIELNTQQERAVQAINGAVLLLAVPGSGKTTVLITRIGYMVYVKGIDPNSILSITYTIKAAENMKKRYSDLFHPSDKETVTFKTIHSLCYEIIEYYCKSKHIKGFQLIEESDKFKILRKLFNDANNYYPSESEIKQLSVEITRVKNNSDLNKMVAFTDNFKTILSRYCNDLKNNNLMDYDDQIRYARDILKNNNSILQTFKSKYKYICVDEAQDTSKTQHQLIKLLSGDNIFMVGDEDQSIYSFRGAFPRALTAFETDYNNPYILRMETNYRSYKKITDAANSFIRRNSNRHPKAMFAFRGNGGTLNQLTYNSRETEIDQIYELCCDIEDETAVIYRDSDCAISLIAQLIINNIPFNLKQNSTTFFTNRSVLDILSFIRLATNLYDYDSFMSIYYKGKIKLKKAEAQQIVSNAKRKHISIATEIKYYPKGKSFLEMVKKILPLNPCKAVEYISKEILALDNSYGKRCTEELSLLGKYVNTLKKFPQYVDSLCEKIKSYENITEEKLTLSTIHSAKGMEFKNVIILDVCEGIIPKTPIDALEENENKKDLYQEERRLFYVAMTRAKDKLSIVRLKNKSCPFADEIFNEYEDDYCPYKSKSYKRNKEYESHTSEENISLKKNTTKDTTKTGIDKEFFKQKEKNDSTYGFVFSDNTNCYQKNENVQKDFESSYDKSNTFHKPKITEEILEENATKLLSKKDALHRQTNFYYKYKAENSTLIPMELKSIITNYCINFQLDLQPYDEVKFKYIINLISQGSAEAIMLLYLKMTDINKEEKNTICNLIDEMIDKNPKDSLMFDLEKIRILAGI